MKTIDNEALARRMEAARHSGDPAILDRIESLLRDARDVELAAMSPRRLALAEGIEAGAVLRAFLLLAKEGVLEPSWFLRCPHCLGAARNAKHLLELERTGACPDCGMDYEAAFDRDVELCFAPNPEVVRLRDLDPFEAMVTGLELEPGINLIALAGERRSVEFDLREGNYLVLNRAGKSMLSLVVDPERFEGLQLAGFRFLEGREGVRTVTLKAGRTRLILENAAAEPRELHFARVREPLKTDAALVSTLQDFRDFFPRESVAPGQAFPIGNLAFLFTNIKGSTEMCARLGDALAFRIVREHFAAAREVVREQGGAVVKTMGDAMMAVFARPADALRAACALVEAFESLDFSNELEGGISIRIGAHSGPCVAVSPQGHIDYFGAQVNLAAAIPGLSLGNDVVLSDRLYRDSGAEGSIDLAAWRLEKMASGLKGLPDGEGAWRLSRVKRG